MRRMKMPSRGDGRWSAVSIAHLTWRVLQFIAGIVVLAIYATAVNSGFKPLYYDRSRFVFGLVVGIFGTISAFVYGVASLFIPYSTLCFGFAWEWILTILFAAVAGLFSSMYLHSSEYGQKVGAGFDLASLILWGLSAIAATAMFFMRGRRSQFTGRAEV